MGILALLGPISCVIIKKKEYFAYGTLFTGNILLYDTEKRVNKGDTKNFPFLHDITPICT